MRKIFNTDIPFNLWMTRFNRDQLRMIALLNGIKRGRDKEDTAWNLANGNSFAEDGTKVKFEMHLFVA